ncbi:MAG: ABC transporter permease [Chloroflexi bacterium]|jgi:spermidine/putrescine transport system permease protein|nr:ABC transporter permease [Chloroflexota bacterium]
MTDQSLRQAQGKLRSRRETWRLLFLISPSLFWLIVFFLVPLLLVLAISFGQRGTYGGVRWDLTLENYARFFDPLYLRIFGRTIVVALTTTAICLLAGYPLAYFIATRPPSRRNALLLLLMIPFWTNFLIRTYAWLLILRDQGVINTIWTTALHGFLAQAALAVPLPIWGPLLEATAAPLHLFGTDGAIIVGLVYGWLPDMVLPCYASIEQFDFSLVEAAQDLYANRFKSFMRVILPLTMPGIVAGSILVFIPSLGAYVTPDLLGGAKSVMIGNIIYSQFMSARDYPFGSAISFVLMAVMLIGTLIYFRLGTE